MVINSRNKVYSVFNTEMLNLYWNIGKIIIEIQQGDERASYGDKVMIKAEFEKDGYIANRRLNKDGSYSGVEYYSKKKLSI